MIIKLHMLLAMAVQGGELSVLHIDHFTPRKRINKTGGWADSKSLLDIVERTTIPSPARNQS
jgi:hypothetical protein